MCDGVSADGTELVRHFLIEPSPKGVKLKGCNNEPVFGTLSALVYQHSITPLALPCKLLLPEYDPAASPEHLNAAQALLEQGAGKTPLFLFPILPSRYALCKTHTWDSFIAFVI